MKIKPLLRASIWLFLLAGLSCCLLQPRAAAQSCVSPPSGLVGWWTWENNGNDFVGGDTAALIDSPAFGIGKVGQALQLGTGPEYAVAPATPSLDVGTGNGLTIELWINPDNVSNAYPLVEWNSGDGTGADQGIGVHFWLDVLQGSGGFGSLYYNLREANGTNHTGSTNTSIVTTNAWQHVALTYDKTANGGTVTIYVNGVVKLQNTGVGAFTPQTSYPLYFGHRHPPGGYWYDGALDEVSIYNRALTSAEINAIVSADSSGKCNGSGSPTTTTVTSSPNPSALSQQATFTATITGSGTPTGTVQFKDGGPNGTAINGPATLNGSGVATTTTSSLTAGNHTIFAIYNGDSNFAVSTGTLPGGQTVGGYAAPANLVAWYAAETNFFDSQGPVFEDGTNSNNVTFTTGKIGQAFSFFGNNSVGLASPPALRMASALTVEAWVSPTATGGLQRNVISRGSNSFVMQLAYQNGAYNLRGQIFTNGPGGAHLYITDVPGVIPLNTFTHIAMTYNASAGTLAFYINGAPAGTTATTTDNLDNVTGNVTIGNGFIGQIDEASIYDRALSAAEIATAYNSGLSAGKWKAYDANLSNLTLGAGTLTPAFSSGTTSYTASVGFNVTGITVTPTAADSNTRVTVNGTLVASGSASSAINLAVGNNTITVATTAQEGTITKSYSVVVNRAAQDPNTNADLSNLVLSAGTISPAFSPNTTSYTLTVPFATTSTTVTPTLSQSGATVTVNGQPVTSGNASSSISLNVGSNTMTTIVTALDGTTTKTYTVTVTRSKAVSTTAVASTVNPSNSGQQVTFTALVNGSSGTPTGTVQFTSDGTNLGSAVTLDGSGFATTSTSSLAVGTHAITADYSGDATYQTSTGTLSPGQFVSGGCYPPPANLVAWYSAENNNNDVQGPTFENGSNSGSGNAFVAGIVGQAFSFNGSGFVTMGTPSALVITGNAVTLEGWVNPNALDTLTKIYFGRSVAGGNDYLLLNNAGKLSGCIKTSTETFVDITGTNLPANTWSHIALTYDGTTMKVFLNGAVVGSAAKTGNIANDASAPFFVGGRTSGGTINFSGKVDEVGVFNRALADFEIASIYNVGSSGKCKSSNADLSNLTLSTGSLSPAFGSGTTSYTASVANSVGSITVTPTAADSSAKITVNGNAVSSGAASGSISLNIGNNTITTTVTAQDGTTSKTYTLVVNRAANTNANLSNLVLGAGTISPAFDANTTSYTLAVLNSTTTTTVTPTVADSTATVTVNGQTVTSGSPSGSISLNVGDNIIPVVVTAQDGSTTKTYTITVTRSAPAGVLQFSAANYNDGETNATHNATVTVTRTNGSAGAVSVHYATSNGTALAGSDYTATSGDLNWADGDVADKTLAVSITGDTVFETNETVNLTLSAATAGATIGVTNPSTLTIINDDIEVTVAVAPASVPEDGATNLVYTFTRNGVTTGTLTANFGVSGTAQFGTDYTQTGADTFTTSSGTVTFGAGDSTAAVTVDPSVDSTVETNETAILTVTSGTGYSVGSPSAATGTITNDDGETDVTLSSGNLVITDINGGTSTDTLTISLNGANVRVNDPNNPLAAGAGTTSIDVNTVEVPLASITGNILANTLAGNDTLTLALAGGDCVPNGGLTYNGGAQTSTPGDKLVITGGSQGTVTYNYTNANNGNIVMSNFGTVTYTGLEPITNSGTATDIIFNLPAAASTATLADDGTASNTLSRLSATTFETTDFANPTSLVTINRGNAADTLAVSALPDFNSSLTIGAGATVFASVTFSNAVTLAANKNLAVFALGTISLSNAASDLATSGTGTISMTTARNISLVSGASLTTVNGALTLNANQQAGATTGTFVGVSLIGANVEATGTGLVTVNGKGGTVSGTGGNAGVFMNTSALVKGGSNGAGVMTTDIFGTGGTGGSNPHGVDIETSCTVTSYGGDVRVRGFAGAGTDKLNYGVIPLFGGTITSGGNGNVLVQGTGGTHPNGGNVGVMTYQDGTITSGGTGTVSVSGTAGNGALSYGVQIFRNGRITSGGTGAVSVSGTGGGGAPGVILNAADNSSPGARINSGGGPITVTATGTGTAGAIALGGGTTPTGTNTNTIASTVNASITLIADVMVLDGVGINSVNSGTGITTLRPSTNGKTISLGGNDLGTPLGLTDGELDLVTAGTLNIGNANTGAITVSSTMTRTTATAVNITSGANIDITTGSLSNTGGNLTLLPGTNVFPSNSGVDVTTNATSTLGITSGKSLKIVINNTTVDTGYTQLNVVGRVDISGVNLALSGTVVPVAGQAYTIVNNDGSDAITGTFAGLAEAAILPNFFGSGLNARISYVDGTGNDAVIRVLPTISIGNVTVNEAGGNAVFTVTQSAISGIATTFQYSTANGTASAPDDYTVATNLTGTIPAGSTSTTISIPIINDVLYEAANETFTVTLSNPVNASIVTGTGTATIQENETVPSISIGNVSVGENGGNAVFTVTQSTASVLNTTFTYSTANGTAVAPGDYTSASNVAGSIPAGSTSTTISIPIINDVLYEAANENFTVTLSNPVNASIVTATGTATIQENDPVPSISIGNVSVNENGGNAVFTVTQSAVSVLNTTFTYSTANGTAVAPGDYTSASNVAGSITAGNTTTTISIPIIDHPLVETTETFTVTLATPANATIATATGTGTITDDDEAPLALPVSATTNQGQPKSITLSGFDGDGDSQTFSIVAGPAHGTLGAISVPNCSSGGCTATVLYTPATGYSGPDSFTYKSNDGFNDGNVATVSLTVRSSNAFLSSLTLSVGTLDPAFAPGITGYDASVPNSASSMTVTPVTANATATLTVQGTPSASGSPSNPIGLVVGSNTINVVVTAADTTTSITYSITVIRQTNRESWRMQHFGTAANTGDAADTSDPEGDGLSNFLEFATGSDPHASNPSPAVLVINGTTIEFDYSRSIAAINDGVTFNVQFQDDLTAGGWSTAGVTQQLLPGGSNGVELWRASVSTGLNGRRFLRLNVSRPTP